MGERGRVFEGDAARIARMIDDRFNALFKRKKISADLRGAAGGRASGGGGGVSAVPNSGVLSLRKTDGGTERTGDIVLRAASPLTLTETSEVSGDAGFEYGYSGPILARLDESCANNTTTNITLGDINTSMTFQLAYSAATASGGMNYVEGGRCTVVAYATAAHVIGWERKMMGDGRPLVDGTGLTADVDSGNVRLKVTTADRGAACDFRVTYFEVAS